MFKFNLDCLVGYKNVIIFVKLISDLADGTYIDTLFS